MRTTDLIIIASVLLLFYIGKPSDAFRGKNRQAQEAPLQELIVEVAANSYQLTYEVDDEDETPIADILWLKRAAQLAIENDLPYFNVSEMEVQTRTNPDSEQTVTVVEGIIKLETDAAKAEYDAFVIEDLVLPHHTEY
jgi:hypothetical protein